MKVIYGVTQISLRRFDGSALSSKDLSDYLKSWGFSYLDNSATWIPNKASTLFGKMVVLLDENEFSMIGEPERLHIVMALIQKSLLNATVIRTSKKANREMSTFTDKKSVLMDELDFIKAFAADVLPIPTVSNAEDTTFEEKQKMFQGS